jgi:DNA repair protein RadD
MPVLRDYQQRAIESTLEAFRAGKKNVLLTAATGSGKSILIAEIARRRFLLGNRTLILCHRSEILRQNEATLRAHGVTDVGVYCAKVDGRKERHNAVVLASPQSLGREPGVCGKFGFVIVDEAHLCPPDIHKKSPPVGEKDRRSQYAKILSAVDNKWLLGLTGSPYRMDSSVIYGKGKQFEYQADVISTKELQDRGFLALHILPRAPSLADVRGVKINKATQDYDTAELEKLFGTERIVAQAVAKWWEGARDRKTSLFFCCSIAHANMVMEAVARYVGPERVAMVNGETETRARKKIIEDARAGRYRALVNVDVLTTGTDVPVIDCVVFLRATKSTSLWIQAVGRGLRLCEGKGNALILDMAGNWERFAGIDDPMVVQANASVRTDGVSAKFVKDELAKLGIEEDEEYQGTTKECPSCEDRQPGGVKVCRKCGHVFISHSFTPAEMKQKNLEGWRLHDVSAITFDENHITNKGRKCVRASVVVKNSKAYTFWLMVYEESGFTGRKTEHKRWLNFLKSNPPQVFIRSEGPFPELQNMTFSL